MAENINYQGGKASYFGTQPAWWDSNGSYLIDGALTAKEAIEKAQMDWEVKLFPIQTCVADDCVEVPGFMSTVRTDTNTPLGIVKGRYTVLQNKDAFSFMDKLVGEGHAAYESAGVLGSGERIWISCKVPDTLKIGNNDVAENYFFITNSHDGTGSIMVAMTNVFIVCNNTLNLAMETTKNKFRARHTANSKTRLDEIAALLGYKESVLSTKKEQYTAMTKVKITDLQLRKFIELAISPEREQLSPEEFSSRFTNKVDAIMEYALGDPAQLIEERKGNLWGAYNAISGYYNNVETGKSKLESVMFGNGYRKIKNSFDIASKVLFDPSLSILS